jgi:hypothetical protein
VTPTPITVPKRCRLTIALVRAALAIKNSTVINTVVKGSRPTAAMGEVRVVRTGGEKKNKATSSAMPNPIKMRQSGA